MICLKRIFFVVLSFFAFILGNKITYIFRTTPLAEIFSENFSWNFFEDPTKIYLGKEELLGGVVAVIGLGLFFLYHKYDRKNFREKTEHGSAEWGEKKDILRVEDKNEERNKLFTQTEKMSLNTRKTFKNNNTLVIGGSGSGKTRFFVKPNLMQMNSSFVITDPKGELLSSCGKMLKDNGYEIKIFDLINFENSDKYNFFKYIRDERDILKLTNNIIMNTNSPNSKSAGDFWEKAENALLQALFSYVFYEGTEEEKNINTVMELLRLSEVKEDDEDFKSPLDILFDELKKENPNHFAVKQYDIFKFAAGKTAKSILVSVGVRLAPFNIDKISELLSEDTLELEFLGDRKTALFIIIPDSDVTLNFISAIMYQQLFDLLFYRADHIYKGALPYEVAFWLDEFANIGQIPNLEIYVSTMRSRKISVNIILQNLTQLKTLYKNSWETITGNCDSLLFLGGKEQSTLKYLSEMIGKTTVDYRAISENRGTNGSYSVSNQLIARDLITAEEISLLEKDECILSIRGIKPFLSKKYDIEKHKNYSLLLDSNKENVFRRIEKSTEEKVLEEIEKVEELIELEELEELEEE